jgi:hypothetical protein
MRLGLNFPSLFRAIAASALVSLIITALFFALNRESLNNGLPAARAHILKAFADKELVPQDYLRGDTQIGHHQYNDCLILGMAIDQRWTVQELTVSPNQPVFDDPRGQCDGLERLARGEAPKAERDPYHQYVHGHTLLVRLLLPHMDVSTMRAMFKGLTTLTLFLGIGIAAFGLARGRRTQENLFWLILFFAFFRFFGLEAFGQSLSHGPADLVFLGTAVSLCIGSQFGGIRPRVFIPLLAIFGSLTMIFEFLTGGIPLGLALVTGGLPFALRREDAAQWINHVACGLTAFCTGVGVVILCKLAAVLSVFGKAGVGIVSEQLGERMGVNASSSKEVELTVGNFIRGVAKGLDGIVPGSRLMSLLAILAALAAGAWALRQLWHSEDVFLRSRARFLLASNGMVLFMLFLLSQHTMIHAWFMDRVFAWTIGTGFALFGLALIERNRLNAAH